jgi:predicted  nucleic acid-binding Zn-ribbon protein
MVPGHLSREGFAVSVIEKLLQLQEADIGIAGMERELRDIPARQEAERSRLAEHRQALEAAAAELKARQAKIKELEVESESFRGKIAKLRQQQMGLKTNKEFKAVESEIATIEAQIAELEDRELVFMEEVEEARGDVASRQKALDAEAEGVNADIKVLDERAAQIGSRLDAARASRTAIAQTVDNAEWLTRYEQVMAHRKDRALVPLEDSICGGCHMKLRPSAAHDVRKRDVMLSCDFCGRLLYWRG